RKDSITIIENLRDQAKSSKFQIPNSKLKNRPARCLPRRLFGGLQLLWSLGFAARRFAQRRLKNCDAPGRRRVATGFLTPSLELGKAEDGLLEMFPCFVQIRMYLAHPSFTPVEVATGLGAQEPPASLLELFGDERGIHVVSSNFQQRAMQRLAQDVDAREGVLLAL